MVFIACSIFYYVENIQCNLHKECKFSKRAVFLKESEHLSDESSNQGLFVEEEKEKEKQPWEESSSR